MQKKYTLPRHTNLAPLSSRFGAFFLDLALAFIIYLGMFYGVTSRIYLSTRGQQDIDNMNQITLDSGLAYEENGEFKLYDTTEDYKCYENALTHYYLHYLTGNVEEGQPYAPNYNEEITLDGGTKVLPIDYYTVQWYNQNVLKITDEDPDAEDSKMYFTYQKKVDGSFDKEKIGIPKTKRYNPDEQRIVNLSVEDIAIQYRVSYKTAYAHLQLQNFYKNVADSYYFGISVCVVTSVMIAAIITYIVFPLIFKNGKTLGKRVLGLGLANSEGYKFKNKQLIMRILPLTVVALSCLIPVWNSIYILGTVVLIMVLVSFALAMASPKKSSLHDFCARTIVINAKTSVIFEDFSEEAQYLEKEDNLPKEENSGEEPEICYEK